MQSRTHGGSAPAAGDEADVDRGVAQRCLDCVFVVMAHRGRGGPGGEAWVRLAHHDRLRAAAADPAAEAPVGSDDRLVAGPRRCRRLAADDGRQRAWRPVGRVFPKQIQNFVGYSVTPFDLRAAQTLSDVTGMSMLVMP